MVFHDFLLKGSRKIDSAGAAVPSQCCHFCIKKSAVNACTTKGKTPFEIIAKLHRGTTACKQGISKTVVWLSYCPLPLPWGTAGQFFVARPAEETLPFCANIYE